MRKDRSIIVIYGMGSAGAAAYHVIKSDDVHVLFCDDNASKIGKAFEQETIYSYQMIKNLNQKMQFIIAVTHPESIIKKIESDGFFEYHLLDDILNENNILGQEYCKNYEMAITEIKAALYYHKSLKESKLFIRSLDVVITERCSLKCADCANLMQYYQDPKDFNLDIVFQEIKTFLSLVDELYELRILGGEPFMHKDLHKLINKLILLDKVKKIIVYTNATIVPTQEQLEVFQSEKILFVMTDYGDLSRNSDLISALFDEHKILYSRTKANSWISCATIKKHGRNLQELEAVLDRCCAKDIFTLIKGRIFRCPFIANGINLDAIEDIPDESLNLEVLKNDLDYKYKIRAFLDRKLLYSCDFCEGRFLDAKPIMPAIQIKRPLYYLKHKKSVES